MGDGFVGLGNMDLRRDDAALVVHAHQQAQHHIEDNPSGGPGFPEGGVVRQTDRREDQWYGRKQEACFLVRENREEGDTGERGDEDGRDV